jgi:hypothetical protein
MFRSRMRHYLFTPLNWLVMGTLVLVTGCATTSTVDTRKQERYAAYSALTPEQRALVDMSQIQVGMPMDAVYIAWGKPAQVSTGQTSDGRNSTTWIYTGTSWQEHRYWSYRYAPYHFHPRYGYYAHAVPTMEYDYVPRSYVAAEVIFEDGVVKSWRNMSQPPPY